MIADVDATVRRLENSNVDNWNELSEMKALTHYSHKEESMSQLWLISSLGDNTI